MKCFQQPETIQKLFRTEIENYHISNVPIGLEISKKNKLNNIGNWYYINVVCSKILNLLKWS